MKIPDSASREFLTGLKLVSRGKVRDTYEINDELLLSLVTNRISIFDVILGGKVPQKGWVLAATNVFWKMVLEPHVPQDIVAFGADVDNFLPPELRGNLEIQKRGTAVKKLNMIPVEAIIRGYLTGSGWKAYKETAPNHVVCGHSLPAGLKDGDKLPEPIFTPTTKATEGHDEHMDVAEVRKQYPQIEEVALMLFRVASEIALRRGIIIADTKFEFGLDPVSGKLTLGDERFTPDSSRFWLLDDWEKSREEGRSPVSLDKQFVRAWGESVEITSNIDLKNPDAVQRAQQRVIPESVIRRTTQIYRYIFWLLTERRLELFERDLMGMAITIPYPPIEIVVGSESDMPQIEGGLDALALYGAIYHLHIVSCHRNPDALRRYVNDMVPDGKVVIAAASKAAALPGVLQAWLWNFEKDVPVLGVALRGKTEKASQAARLSIEELPGNPVVLADGETAYFGAEGFVAACKAAMTVEFLIPQGKWKEPKFNFRKSQG